MVLTMGLNTNSLSCAEIFHWAHDVLSSGIKRRIKCFATRLALPTLQCRASFKAEITKVRKLKSNILTYQNRRPFVRTMWHCVQPQYNIWSSRVTSAGPPCSTCPTSVLPRVVVTMTPSDVACLWNLLIKLYLYIGIYVVFLILYKLYLYYLDNVNKLCLLLGKSSQINQHHAVSRTLQGRQRALRSPLFAVFWRHCVLNGRTQRRACNRHQSEEMEI